MPTARIEIEHVNKNWVIQVEASSILRSDRKTIYADTIEEAFATALATYYEMEAKVRPQDEGQPRELTPELAEAVARFKEAAEFVAEDEKEKAKIEATFEGEQWTPEQIAQMGKTKQSIALNRIEPQGPAILSMDGMEKIEVPSDLQPGDKLEVQFKPLRGRHPKTCTCEKCVAKRAA